MELQYESDGVSHEGVNRVLHHMLLNQEVPSPVRPIRYSAFLSLVLIDHVGFFGGFHDIRGLRYFWV